MSASIERCEKGWGVKGGMTMETAGVLLDAGVSALRSGAATFDLSAVEHVDSSGLAVLFGWQRAAQALGKPFQIVNPPRNLASLAGVYGVTGLLPLA